MLERLPYPRHLTRERMPLTAPMRDIADIFEALTAWDRPYKKDKTLSEALRNMDHMRRAQHIDPELSRLFLRSGIWLEYAQGFLRPERIDTLDIPEYLEG